MQRKALIIGIACAIGSLHAVGASAQEDDFDARAEDFEITLENILDGPDDADGVIMPLIEAEMNREAEESNDHDDGKSNDYGEGEFEDYDQGHADDYDDGKFDEYDDGEEIQTG